MRAFVHSVLVRCRRSGFCKTELGKFMAVGVEMVAVGRKAIAQGLKPS
jgi:hypothetical protein